MNRTICRVFAFCFIAISAAALPGCSSKSSFTKEEEDQVKNHTHTAMPAGAAAANAKNMQAGAALYQQRLKEAGLLDANGMRKGTGPPAGAAGPPPGATQGPPPGATQGPPPGVQH